MDSPPPRLAQPTEYDVVVVGAGPAGSAAAERLAKGGARVAVLEREHPPRYKTCGGGLVGRTLSSLPGISDFLPERRCRAVQMHLLDSHRCFTVRRESPIVTTVMRADFDYALLAQATRAGAEVRPGCEFRSLSAHDNRIDVDTPGKRIRTRFVLGADGANGQVGRQAGWPAPPAGAPALEAELTVSGETFRRFSEHARFDFGLPFPGYAWVFPKRDHLSAGVLCARRRRVNLRAALSDYLERVGIQAREARIHGFQVPLRPRAGGFARGRVLLCGDAAGLADPVTAEGISFSIRSGQFAAEALLRGGDDPARVRRGYHKRLRREILPELFAGRVLARLLYRPGFTESVLPRVGQPLCEAMTEVLAGRRTYLGLLANPLNYARLLLYWRSSTTRPPGAD